MILACATAPKTPVALTPEISADLKGSWEGLRTISFVKGTMQNVTEMEIQTDAIPFKGKLVVFPLPGQTEITYPFDQGGIKDGKLVILLSENISMELSLYKDDNKLRLEGNFYFRNNMGSIRFTKN